MVTTFAFSEKRIQGLAAPTDREREYHKDKTYPGLQVCVTSAGTKTYYFVKRTDGQPTRHKLGPVDRAFRRSGSHGRRGPGRQDCHRGEPPGGPPAKARGAHP